MSYPHKAFDDEVVNALNLSDGLRYGTYNYCVPNLTADYTIGTTGAAAAGTDATQVCGVWRGGGHPGVIPVDVYPIGTATILVNYYVTGLGLNLTFDATDDEGAQGVVGGYKTTNPWYFTVGTTQAHFIKWDINIVTVAGTDDCCFGWRRYAAYAAAVDDYTDAAFFNINAGNVLIETILNNAATTTVDTTENWLDTENHTLEIQVQANGDTRFLYDDVIQTPRFTFDDGDIIVPFFYCLHAAATTAVYATSVEVGPLSETK